MKKYFISGTLTAFAVIFNLGYVFHELLMGDFFKQHIGLIQRENYIIPLIALAFLLYAAFLAYFLPIYIGYAAKKYGWGALKSALVFGALIGAFWDGLQGGIIEVATFNMPFIVFVYDSAYHTAEGVVTALILLFFYRRFTASS